MNHVWSSVATRVPCGAQSRTSPLLQLFNGYAKSQSTRGFAQWSTLQQYRRGGVQIAAFSTVPCLNARKAAGSTASTPKATKATNPKTRAATTTSPKKAAPRKPSDKTTKSTSSSASSAKLEPPPTIASHTEGLVPAEVDPLTWRDYDPEGGMPLPNGERSQAEINSVFNSEEVNVADGNYILCVMHWRRMSGALIDIGVQFPKDSGITQDQALKGLEYVRQVVPDVDEAGNGQVWAAEEEQRTREELQTRAVKLGLYKAQPDDLIEEEVEEESRQGTPEGRKRSGESVLETHRREEMAKYEQWKQQKEAKEARTLENAISAARGPLELAAGVQPAVQVLTQGSTNITTTKGSTGISIRPPPSQAFLSRPREKPEWIKYYEEQATIIKENTIPQLSTLARLGPAFLVLLLVLGGCYFLSENYTPPPKSARVWPDTPPAAATLGGLTGVLVLAWFAGRIPQLWRFANKYMTCVPAYPYAFSIIGCTFRHDTVVHLASNVASLWLLGLLLHEDVGRGTFLAIYLASGVIGAYSSLVFHVLRKNWATYILGSSGSMFGVGAAACTLRPNGNVTAFGYTVPMAAWVFGAFFVGFEVLALVKTVKTTVDHMGHIGGAVAGGSMALAARMRAQREESGKAGKAGEAGTLFELAYQGSKTVDVAEEAK